MTDKTYSEAAISIRLWLFPAVYLLHIAEEYRAGGGLPAYLARTRGINLGPTKFLVMNAVGWALMIAVLLLARRLKFSQWLLVCMATVLLINGLLHTAGAVSGAEYNPGLVSGLLLFIPLGAATLVRLKKNMRGPRYFGAMLVGIVVHAVISLLTLSGGNFAAL
jgi:Protein of unknown function with HXXEE motif